MRLFFELGGLEKFVRNFRAAAKVVEDRRKAWPRVLEYLKAAAAGQFASSGARGGKVWQELKRSTQRYKDIHFPGKPILRRTDATVNAMTAKGEPDISEKDFMGWAGTDIARIHQKGGKKGRPPKREIVALTAGDEKEIGEIVRRVAADELSGYGFPQ